MRAPSPLAATKLRPAARKSVSLCLDPAAQMSAHDAKFTPCSCVTAATTTWRSREIRIENFKLIINQIKLLQRANQEVMLRSRQRRHGQRQLMFWRTIFIYLKASSPRGEVTGQLLCVPLSHVQSPALIPVTHIKRPRLIGGDTGDAHIWFDRHRGDTELFYLQFTLNAPYSPHTLWQWIMSSRWSDRWKHETLNMDSPQLTTTYTEWLFYGFQGHLILSVCSSQEQQNITWI